jgi:DNA-binding transcriptional LysR family regulator
MCRADLRYMPVYRFEPMLITPPDHPLAHKPDLKLEDLSPYGLILPPKRLTTYRLVDLVFQQNRVPYTVALEVGGWEVIKQYVAMGLGISIVTAICLTESDRTRLAARSLAQYFPVAQLRRGGAQGQVPVAAGARLHRVDPARSRADPIRRWR